MTEEIDALEGLTLDTYIEERTTLATVEQADQPEISPDLQEEVRASGARQIDAFSFATNQGTVILASPADVARGALLDRLSASVDRRRGWTMPGLLGGSQHAAPGRGK